MLIYLLFSDFKQPLLCNLYVLSTLRKFTSNKNCTTPITCITTLLVFTKILCTSARYTAFFFVRTLSCFHFFLQRAWHSCIPFNLSLSHSLTIALSLLSFKPLARDITYIVPRSHSLSLAHYFALIRQHRPQRAVAQNRTWHPMLSWENNDVSEKYKLKRKINTVKAL